MQIIVRNDSVLIDGYVNAIERNSKPLMSRIGMFIERICKGAFGRAIERNNDIHILLNHDWDRDLGSTKAGNLELEEDSIGLHARATITDADVVEKAKRGDLVGWSFGFSDREVLQSIERDLPLREVKDLDLYEVSLLDTSKSPAYEGTLVTVRADENIEYRGEAFIDEVELVNEQEEPTEEVTEETEETREEPTQEETLEEDITEVDYSAFDNMISEMKGDL